VSKVTVPVVSKLPSVLALRSERCRLPQVKSPLCGTGEGAVQLASVLRDVDAGDSFPVAGGASTIVAWQPQRQAEQRRHARK
jgi:hypothetical protein